MRVFFDIETSPNVCYAWRTGYNLTLRPENIVKERRVICICWKVEGGRRVHALDWSRGEKTMLAKFCDAISNADELVAHNGVSFDMAWLRGRCVRYGLVLPDVPCLDTYRQSKRLFNLNNHSLDYLARYLGAGEKLSTDFQLWVDCMDGKAPALRKMVRYCKHDVEILERVFLRLQPYLSAMSHPGASRLHCPVCGSPRTGVHRRRVTAAGLGRIQLRCRACGKYFVLPETTYSRLTA